LGYHLAFPPFFPHQKPFKSDDDFYVKQHEKYENPDLANIENIIDRRRAWFDEEMENKRERNVNVNFYDATGWTALPAGMSSLAAYDTRQVSKIKYGERWEQTIGRFARQSGRDNNVGALFSGYLYVDPLITHICVTSADGSKLLLDDVLVINNDGVRSSPTKVCVAVAEGVYKLDLEYFIVNGNGAELYLEFGPAIDRMRVVPPRSWASVSKKGSSI
jgi:hypothetical protein